MQQFLKELEQSLMNLERVTKVDIQTDVLNASYEIRISFKNFDDEEEILQLFFESSLKADFIGKIKPNNSMIVSDIMIVLNDLWQTESFRRELRTIEGVDLTKENGVISIYLDNKKVIEVTDEIKLIRDTPLIKKEELTKLRKIFKIVEERV